MSVCESAVTKPWPGKCLHARLQQAVHEALGQQRSYTRVAVEGAVANHPTFAMVQVEHRGEAEIHAAGAQLGTQHITRSRSGIGGTQRAAAGAALAILHPHLAQGAHGGQVGEAVGAKALHAAAFVVHANQQVGPHGLDVAAQGGELGTVLPVATEQDDTAGERVGQAAAVSRSQRGAGHVQDDGGMEGRCCHGMVGEGDRSTTQKLAA